MRATLTKLLALSILAFSQPSLAKDQVTVAFSEAMGPYSIETPLSGIEIEIYNEVFAKTNYSFQPVFRPTSRILDFYLNREVEAIAKSSLIIAENDARAKRSLDGTQPEEPKIQTFYGSNTIWFEDVFLTRADADIKEPEDLRNLLTLGFYSSDQHYLCWLTPVIEEGNFGRKTLSKEKQLQMLLSNRVDVLLGDERIFRRVASELSRSNPEMIIPIKITRFSGPYPFSPAFHSEKVRDEFNAGLASLMEPTEDGVSRYDQIVAKYDNSLESSWIQSVTVRHKACEEDQQSQQYFSPKE